MRVCACVRVCVCVSLFVCCVVDIVGFVVHIVCLPQARIVSFNCHATRIINSPKKQGSLIDVAVMQHSYL